MEKSLKPDIFHFGQIFRIYLRLVSTKLAKNYPLVIPALSRDLIIYCKRAGIPAQGRDDEDVG